MERELDENVPLVRKQESFDSEKKFLINKRIISKFPPFLFIMICNFYYLLTVFLYFISSLFSKYFPKMIIITGHYLPIVFNNQTLMIDEKNKFIIYFCFLSFSFCFLNLLLSFFLTYFTNPGTIPDEPFWKMDIPYKMTPQEKIELFALSIIKREEILHDNNNTILVNSSFTTSAEDDNAENKVFYQVNERNDNNEIRYCYTCLMFKPDRAHHCKICNHCILKMDHHCPWIGCCIGFFNYKYFLTLLLYSWICSLFFIIIFAHISKQIIITNLIYNQKIIYGEIFFILIYFASIAFFVFTFVLYFFHWYLVSNNFSTFEYVEFLKKKNIDNHYYGSKYNLGSIYENWKDVYGECWLTWFFPISPMKTNPNWNNGINFKINENYQNEIIKSL